jgi:hypothetical protein
MGCAPSRASLRHVLPALCGLGAEGMRQCIAATLQLGITEEEITLMVKRNPASVLDLE